MSDRLRHVLRVVSVVALLTAAICSGCGGQSDSCPGCSSDCPAGLSMCAQQCVITSLDPANCGTCGNACLAGQFCVSGTCSYECPPGQTLCGDDAGPVLCSDVQNDTANCGSCGNACSTNHTASTCVAGKCTLIACAAEYADCNSVATDGCETALLSDAKNCGRCGHDCCGGICFGGVCQPFSLTSGVGNSQWLVVDSKNVYWTTGYNFADIWSCPVGGCKAPTTLAKGTSPISVALDGTSLYWTDQAYFGNAGVYACSTTGCNNTPTPLITNQSAPTGIAVDASNVYWTNAGTGTDGTIKLCDKASCSSVTTFATEQTFPNRIAVDASMLYWTSADTVRSWWKNGFAGNTSADVILSGQGVVDLALDSTSLYWANVTSTESTVKRCALGSCGGTTVTLAAGQGDLGRIALDTQNVYWLNKAYAGAVLACAKSGCNSPTVLASGQKNPSGIAVDDACVYWVNSATGEVFRVAKP